MITFPNAKINIGLRITGKRPDGYHNLESIFYPIPINDALEAIPAEKFSLAVFENAVPGKTEDNLVYKAYELVKEKFDIPPVKAALLKKIPSGAGLGGGSSDCSFMLKLLDNLFNLNLQNEELEELAAGLGSDCPFFIKNKPAYVTGRGEIIEEIDFSLKGYYLAVVCPGIHISTAEAFKGVKLNNSDAPLKDLIKTSPENWKEVFINDFEEHLFQGYPELSELKKKMYSQGAVYSSMSGSGSAVYGIFDREPSERLPRQTILKLEY